MRFLRESSLHEYAAWYLQREAAKGNTRPISALPEQRVQEMREWHSGKMRNWFNGRTRWHIVQLDAIEEFRNLIFLESEWTKRARLVMDDGGNNYRLLGRVAENALAHRYLDELPPTCKHRTYYDRLTRGAIQLTGKDRIAICSAEPSEIERNPAARYYLLDGVGRCLPYMILFQEGKMEFATIEAFIAEKTE
jgi:hypothetical protein